MKFRFSLLLLLGSLFFQLTALAQRTEKSKAIRCQTAQYYEQLFRKNPSLKKQFEKNQRSIASSIRNGQSGFRITALNDTIPIVVHVVASAAVQQLVTDAVIQSQIDVLNEDFRGLNADSTRIPAHFKPRFGKSKITFQLARTSNLNEPTNGIIRRTTTRKFNDDDFDEVKFNAVGGSTAWNPEEFLNIWVVDFGTSGTLGVSVFPGDPRPLGYHGFVCDYRVFGRGAPYLVPDFNKGRTTTHEIGHFLNLRHIWGDDGGSCAGTDFPSDPGLDDTPNQADRTFGNPDPRGQGVVLTDNCSPNPPGIMYQNYMDYTDDSAMVMFTKGQQERMENALSLSPDRLPLLSSIKYNTAAVYTHDAWIRAILSPGVQVCNSTFRPVVVLRNSGTTPLTSVAISAVLNNGTPVVFNWTGNLAPYTETEVTLPNLTGTSGINNLTVSTGMPNGVADKNPSNNAFSTTFEVVQPRPLPDRVVEGFSAPQFPPPGWRVYNPDRDMTWERHATIGKNAPGSAWFNDFNNETFYRFDDLIMPSYTFSNKDSVFLSFNLAAATYSDPRTTDIDIDTLAVLISKDCGATFTTVYKKWGAALQTLNNPNEGMTDEFLPTSRQWRKDSINLTEVLGNSVEQFQVYFRLSANFENNVFIDDVELRTVVLPQALKEQGYLILPSPFRTSFTIWHLRQPTNLKFVNVYNSTGQLVWRREYNRNADNQIHVNLQGAAAGVYIVEVIYTDGARKLTQRIVKH